MDTPVGSHALWARARERIATARARGVQHSFECTLASLEAGDARFVVRIPTRFPKGETAAGRAGGASTLPANPFLAPEPELVVGDVGPAHRALLNKFSVLDEHLLLTTRDFIDQRTPLGLIDFAALAQCLDGPRVLAFYNGGALAGASQTHKHMQLVSLPLAPHAALPIEPLLEGAPASLPFRHAVARLEPGETAAPERLLARYHDLLAAAGIEDIDGLRSAYNLVLTDRWMLVVPRTRDRFEGISINSLAFAGSFFVRDEAQFAAIRAAGPLGVMRAVGRA